MKICGTCKENKSLENFNIKSKKGNNIKYQSYCKDCQNKYRLKHYELNKSKYIKQAKINSKKTVDWFLEIKSKLFCNQCHEDRYWVLDFHHINPDEKDTEVSALVYKSSKAKILKEIEKCIVLCSNCHRDLHYNLKNN